MSYTEARAEKILYSAEAMGSEGYPLFIAPDNTEIRPDDFSTLNGKRVGVNKNSIQEQLFVSWAKSYGVSPQIVESTEKTPVLLEMLANGEFDALVNLDTYGNSADVVPVCKVGFANSFFGINKNRPDLKQDLDVAMNRIFEDNRDFNQQLTEKFNKGSAVNSFLSADEKDWVSDHGTIRVGYRDNFLPFCDTDAETKELTGTLLDFLSFAETCEKNARLSFSARGFDTTEAALQAMADGEIDCVFPLSLSAYDGEKRGVIITDPLVVTEMFAAVRTADHLGVSPEREMLVAVIKGNPNCETFLMDCFPNWKSAYYEDGTSALQAVAAGEADCALISNYRLDRMSALCSKYKLSPLATGQVMDMSFAVRREDDCLYSILNKISRLMPDSAINSSLTGYSFSRERVTFTEYLRDNLAYAVAGIAVIVSIILRYVEAEIDTDDLAECIRTGVESEKYHELQTVLDKMRARLDIHFIYVIIPLSTEPVDNIQNVIAGVSQYEYENMADQLVHLNMLTGDSYSPATAKKYLDAYNTGKLSFFEEISQWGDDYTGLLPLYDSAGNRVAALCVDVDIAEIHTALRDNILIDILLIVLLGVAFIAAFFYWIERNVTKPIEKLETSVVEFAAKCQDQKDPEALTIDVPAVPSENEVGLLAEAVSRMSEAMRDYVKNIQYTENELARMIVLANKDPLTLVRNKNAFVAYKIELNAKLRSEEMHFAVVMVDLNDLKKVNDSFGHEKGDRYIIKNCRRICEIFDHSPVFRIGGDEFVVILLDRDYADRDRLIESVRTQVAATAAGPAPELWDRFSVAIGTAEYEPGTDSSVEDVLIRADLNMYDEKKLLKS